MSLSSWETQPCSNARFRVLLLTWSQYLVGRTTQGINTLGTKIMVHISIEMVKHHHRSKCLIQLPFTCFYIIPFPFLAVNQGYQTEASNEYVILGNFAVMKCVIPSFVTDLVNVVGWQNNQGDVYTLGHIGSQNQDP